jgi:hypothetical protein
MALGEGRGGVLSHDPRSGVDGNVCRRAGEWENPPSCARLSSTSRVARRPCACSSSRPPTLAHARHRWPSDPVGVASTMTKPTVEASLLIPLRREVRIPHRARLTWVYAMPWPWGRNTSGYDELPWLGAGDAPSGARHGGGAMRARSFVVSQITGASAAGSLPDALAAVSLGRRTHLRPTASPILTPPPRSSTPSAPRPPPNGASA